ncbi:MAG: hypothetical protein GF330_12585 [Candidatus Eisenbacteria bacterium]|nr:hypothetical protein [Candidatus Eisenbacteria bacterium]
MKLERLARIDRRIVYLLIGIGTVLPILFPIGFPVSTTPPVERLFEKIESLGPDDVVLVSFDYGPTTAPENSPMAEAVLRHCLSRRIKVIAIALFPIGGVTMAGEVMSAVTAEYPELRDGEDYVLLGYKDGAQAAMKQIGIDIASVFPTSMDGRTAGEIPLMRSVRNYDDIALVCSFATNIIGEWWANLINAQFGTPIAVGTTAVSAPKYYAFLDSGQMLGLLGGLKGASEYEQLLLDAYPDLRARYARTGVYTAMKGMDAQTVDHAIIMLFILIGNGIHFLTRRQRQSEESG